MEGRRQNSNFKYIIRGNRVKIYSTIENNKYTATHFQDQWESLIEIMHKDKVVHTIELSNSALLDSVDNVEEVLELANKILKAFNLEI